MLPVTGILAVNRETVDVYTNILDKLNHFTRKFYTKMLVKGLLLFLFLGLVFFFVISGVEYFLWLNSTGRFILLMLFILVEVLLLFRFIIHPGGYLLSLKNGITHKEASLLIGKYFPEVDDKLYNLLDLAEDKRRSELLLASIEQRSTQLDPIPFSKAIDFRENLRYAKYLVIPALIFGIIWVSGNLDSFFGSYRRVVHYDTAFEPPAPFRFRLLTGDLRVLKNEPLTIQVGTEGEVKPEDVYIALGDRDFLMQERNGLFQYSITPPLQSSDFYFKANGIISGMYHLEALEAPAIHDFGLVLEYPGYIHKPREIIKSTGNAIFPEGTTVTWEITGKHTEQIRLITADTAVAFQREGDNFRLSKTIFSDLAYELAASNENVTEYEKLAYKFSVTKDAYPSIKARQVLDSLNPNVAYYAGEVADDYALTSLKVVCYPDRDPDRAKRIEIAKPQSNFQQFYYTFPSGFELDAGEGYSLYFEVSDNDAIHHGKTTRSQVFNMTILDQDQLKNKDLEVQESILRQMDKSLDNFREQKEGLENINREQKEKNSLNFSDQRQIRDFLRKQQLQEQLMQEFSSRLKENLGRRENDDRTNKLLQERLERQEMEARKNEQLLKELNKIADKIDKAELTKKLEELAKNQQNSQRSLEQLLELTKRYYVTEKAAQLARDLAKEAREQEALAEKQLIPERSHQEQKELNANFEEISRQLEQLSEDNEKLKKPLPLQIDSALEKGVKQDQKEALDEIEKQEGEQRQDKESSQGDRNSNKAQKRQQSAADRMQEMSKSLGESAVTGEGGSTITEDVSMLRQILDNLVIFSLEQEKLYDQLEGTDPDVAHFSGNVKRQQELRNLFEHVDDSLFALSLRRVELSEFINEQITEVYYNIDKALENMAENQIYQGVSYQQYVLTASNNLADYLANILDHMQASLAGGSGSGAEQGFQLPDIIRGQGELQRKMGSMSGQGKEGKEGQEGDTKKGNGGERGTEGNKGHNPDGNKDGDSEGDAGEGREGRGEDQLREIYDIYKEQQMLRNQLERQLEDMIRAADKELAAKLMQQMEDFEDDLLENGITRRTLDKMNTIQHQLLKLENATLKQGEKQERESITGKEGFTNPITTKPELLRDNRGEIEILNRQTLPLRQIYLNKVKDYFKRND